MNAAMKGTRGELPAGWRWVKLGEVCAVVGGSTPDTGHPAYWDGDIVWVTPTDLGKLDDIMISMASRRISFAGLQSCGTEMLPIGSVIMSSRAPIGHLAIADTPLCTNQGCKSFIPSPEVDSPFLYWSLKNVMPDIRALGSGATFAEVSKSALQEFRIPIPPLPEQQRIAAILREQMAAAEKARAAAQARLEAVKALPAAFLRQVFPQPGHRLPAKWRWIRLGEICDEMYRYPSFYGMTHLSSGIPVIRGEHIDSRGEISTIWTDYWYVSPEDSAKFPRTILMTGDLVFTVRGTIGKTGIIRQIHAGAQLSPNLIRISPSGSVESEYLWLFLGSTRGTENAVEDNSVTVATVKAADLQALPIPLPPLPEQQRVAEVLREQMAVVEKAHMAAKAELDAINALPAALLRRAFNGEI